MKKYAVISTSNSSEYYSLIPLVAYSWHKLGYTPIVIMVNCPLDLQELIGKYCPEETCCVSLPSFEGVKDGTIAQFSRLFASLIVESDAELITGDGDMIVMKDIFTNSGLTSYGMDLTGGSCLPICYVKGSVTEWKELMKVESADVIENILDQLPPDAFSEDWNLYWDVDQDVLLERAKEYGFNRITFVNRGFSGPVAANRWDRYNWHVIPADIIDVHCIRGLNRWDEITAMAEYLFPGEVGWMGDFYNEIRELPQEPHTCPYAQEIHYDSTTLCTCSIEKQIQCSREI